MPLQDQYDEAMHEFSMANFDAAIERLQAVLQEDPEYFDARLSLGMAYYRKGDYAQAIAEGHKAEKLKPHEQLVHTNLSLFYMRSGDKKTAEHHGLQARIAGWRTDAQAQKEAKPEEPAVDPELQMAKPKPAPIKLPEMPWKKKPPAGGGTGSEHGH